MIEAASTEHTTSSRPTRAPRVGVVCDMLEEDWFSMNLVADMLLAGLRNGNSGGFAASRLRPPMRRRFTGAGGDGRRLFNADRLLNRFWDYPRWLRRRRDEFELFHVVDHSYAQLVHCLPPERTVVTCHDLDTFRCVLEPEAEPRSPLFKAMTRRVLEGFRRAARVACDSRATRDALVAHKLVPPERLAVIPNGVHPAFSRRADAGADREAERLLGPRDACAVELLHVGSTIARKRVDVLLKVFAEVRREFPRARLIRAGGGFTAEQRALAESLGVADSVVVLSYLSAEELAAVYRRAALVLLPSEREGFGLPVVEAMACGTPVVASDLDVLREVGGDVAAYCSVGEVAAWSKRVTEMLRLRCTDEHEWDKLRTAGIAQAAKFTWSEYATRMVGLYKSLSASGGSH